MGSGGGGTDCFAKYACRAGTTTTYSFGDDDAQLGEYAWYRDNSEDTTRTRLAS